MATQLSNIETHEISFVRKGANRKRFNLTKGELVETETEIQKAAKDALEKAQADLASVTAKLEALEKAAGEAKVKAEADAAALEKSAKDALEKAEFEKAALEKALAVEKDAKELGAEIAKAAVEFKNLPAKAEDLGTALRALRKADATATSKLEALLKSVDAMLAQSLDPKGKTTGEAASAWDKIEKAAVELTKAEPKLTHASAIDRVLKTNPSLYDEHNAEKTGR